MNAFADVHYLPIARYEQVDTRFDKDLGIYWAWMNPKPPWTTSLTRLAVSGISNQYLA